ncbi:MAG: glycosyltransferase [Desulfurococcales archaeon]|nr:glycosyltransferase [Desulfurococcales archaeon]
MSNVSVVVPARNEARFISRAIKAAKRLREVKEVIVVDGGSIDKTPEIARRLGAKVIYQSILRYPGKGIAMRDGFYYSTGEIITFFDADIKNISSDFIKGLYQPILDGEADFVKGSFGRKAGRVTELVAKPLLRMFYPELSKYSQPLSGEIAGLRKAFEIVEWEPGWGVDIGILIDVYRAGLRIIEKDLGFKDHDMKPLELLTEMAYEVAETILRRAVRDGKITSEEMKTLLKQYSEIRE